MERWRKSARSRRDRPRRLRASFSNVAVIRRRPNSRKRRSRRSSPSAPRSARPPRRSEQPCGAAKPSPWPDQATESQVAARLGSRTPPSKSKHAKQNQAKALGFAWFYSSESGLFNGLRRKKIKNPFSSILAHRRIASAFFRPVGIGIARVLIFAKNLLRKIARGPP